MDQPQNPAVTAVAVTPHDTNDLAEQTIQGDTVVAARALYIGTAGALRVNTILGDTVTFGNVGVGILPLMVTRVFSTGTVATNIVALY